MPAPQVAASPPPSATTPGSAATHTRFLYTANSGLNGVTIQGYSVEPATGVPMALPSTTTINFQQAALPIALRPDSSGSFLFLLLSQEAPSCSSPGCGWLGTNALLIFRIDPSTGMLSQAASSPILLPEQFYSWEMVLSRATNLLYIGSSAGLWVFRFNPTSATLSQVRGTPVPSPSGDDVGYQQMAFSGDGRFMFAAGGSNAAAYALDLATGLPAQKISEVSASAFESSTALSADENYFYVSGADGIAVLKTGQDGSFKAVAGSPFSTFWPQLQWKVEMTQLLPDSKGRFLFGQPGPSVDTFVFTVQSTGVLTPIGGNHYPTLQDAGGGEGVAEDADGRFLYLSGPGGIGTFAIGSDGALTPVSNGSNGFTEGIPIVAVNLR